MLEVNLRTRNYFKILKYYSFHVDLKYKSDSNSYDDCDPNDCNNKF